MFNNQFLHKDAELRFFVFLALGLSLLVVSSYVLGSRVERGDTSAPTERASVPFPEVTLQARAAYVYDTRTNAVLYAKNENTRMPLASLTKVMTALVARELSPDYGTVTVTRESLEPTGDSGLLVGEKWSLKDLLDFSLITSSNDGMRTVALSLGALRSSSAEPKERVDDFVNEMNKKATALDLKNTYFWNETGLDESEYKGGAYGTARDMAHLMDYITRYYPEALLATREPLSSISSMDNIIHEAKNTNTLAGFIPGLKASKTGYTNTAGGNLVFVFDPELGRPIVVTILGSTEQGRFEDAKLLIESVLKYINQ